jgi:carbonic anhydrase
VSDCASSAGDVEANIRADIQVLRTSPYVRNEMPIIGYVLDVEAGQLREVKYVQSLSIVQSPVMPLVWHSVGGSPPSQ